MTSAGAVLLDKWVRANMRTKFELLLSERDIKHSSALLPTDKYLELITEIKACKKTEKKMSYHYWLLRHYDVLEVDEEEKLIVPKSESKADTIFYCTSDELFNILYDAHLALDHAGRDRMLNHLNPKYKNITQVDIKTFLNLCEICQKRRANYKNITPNQENQNEKKMTSSQMEFKQHDNQELEDIPMIHDISNYSNSGSNLTTSEINSPPASTSSSRKRKKSADGDNDSTNSFVIKTEEIEIDHHLNDSALEQDDMEDDHLEGGCSDSTWDLAETKNNFQSDEKNDSLDYFGKYISSLLRDLPELISYQLQYDITRQVLDAHLTNRNSTSNNHLDTSKKNIGEKLNNANSIPHNFP